MPVEIKELVIRAVVDTKPSDSNDETGTSFSTDDKVDVVESCVRQVLKILKKEKER